MKINLSLNVDMPKQHSQDYKYKNLHDKVCDYMLICESDEDSEYHYKYLKCIYKNLIKKNNLPQELKDLMKKLTEFMTKYSRQDSGEDQLDISAEEMSKYTGQDYE